MRRNAVPKTGTPLDYAYIAPAVLLLLSFVCGLIPALFCYLNKILFAYLSLALFLLSIGFHIYTLILWRRYRGMAPLAYAIGQPSTHFAVLTFATIVSATMTCERLAEANRTPLLSSDPAMQNILFLEHFEDILNDATPDLPDHNKVHR